MLRNPTAEEMIAKYREALSKYADPANWNGNVFLDKNDVNLNDCAGLYFQNGETARQALLFDETSTICVKGMNKNA